MRNELDDISKELDMVCVGDVKNMDEAEVNVILLSWTQLPEMISAIAARRCRSDMTNYQLMTDVFSNKREKAARCVQNVMDSGHTSVIEHVTFTFMIEGVSRDLLAQITRHRIASFSVESQRSVDYSDGFSYYVPEAIREMGDDEMAEYSAQMATICEWYSYWVKKGLSPEDARYVLPGATETKFVITMNARELLNFFSQRCCNRAQREIRELANKMLEICKETAPGIFAKAGAACQQTGRCPEGKLGCGKMKQDA